MINNIYDVISGVGVEHRKSTFYNIFNKKKSIKSNFYIRGDKDDKFSYAEDLSYHPFDDDLFNEILKYFKNTRIDIFNEFGVSEYSISFISDLVLMFKEYDRSFNFNVYTDKDIPYVIVNNNKHKVRISLGISRGLPTEDVLIVEKLNIADDSLIKMNMLSYFDYGSLKNVIDIILKGDTIPYTNVPSDKTFCRFDTLLSNYIDVKTIGSDIIRQISKMNISDLNIVLQYLAFDNERMYKCTNINNNTDNITLTLETIKDSYFKIGDTNTIIYKDSSYIPTIKELTITKNNGNIDLNSKVLLDGKQILVNFN